MRIEFLPSLHVTSVAARKGSKQQGATRQPPAGTLELHHDDGLSARATAALGVDAQSLGLAPGEAVSAVAGPESGWSLERAIEYACQQQSASELAADTSAEAGERPGPALRVIDLLRQYTPAYLDRYGMQAVPQVQKVLAKLGSAGPRPWAGTPRSARSVCIAARSTTRASTATARCAVAVGGRIGWPRPPNCCSRTSTISKSCSHCRMTSGP